MTEKAKVCFWGHQAVPSKQQPVAALPDLGQLPMHPVGDEMLLYYALLHLLQ